MVVSFAMLLNLASVAGALDKDGLWGFIRRYAPDASPETHPDLDAAAGYALRYFADFVAPTRQFRPPTDKERAAMEDLRARLVGWDGGLDAEALQTMVFAVGTEHGFDPLRDWFTALYEVLLGQSQGPRFGGFIALYGVDETVALIDRGLSGALAA
jgi:lysyl-tRNA synthetase class 1